MKNKQITKLKMFIVNKLHQSFFLAKSYNMPLTD